MNDLMGVGVGFDTKIWILLYLHNTHRYLPIAQIGIYFEIKNVTVFLSNYLDTYS